MIEKLNEKQLEAVKYLDGNLLIVAGPGSGKTKTIINKIAFLLDKNVNPKNILALTFTNKAAKEMKERLRKLCGEKAENVFLSTFHSFALRTLKIYPLKEFGKDFTIYDEKDSLSLIKSLIKSEYSDDLNPNELVSLFSLMKDEMINEKITVMNEEIKRLYREYNNELLKAKAMDFGDLILNLIKRTKEDGFGEYLSNRYKYIIVDEFQDTNIAQYELLKSISSKSIVTVVGDEDQAIYGWRGAEVENMMKFPEDFRAKTIVLNINYRSYKKIVQYSQHLIENNTLRYKKEIKAHHTLKGDFEILDFGNDKEEARFIASQIKHLNENIGIPLNEIAVFYRINSQSKLIEEFLRNTSIPYQVIGDVAFYQRKEVKSIIYFLRLAVNENDIEAFKKIINMPPKGIGKNTIDFIVEKARTENGLKSFMDTLMFNQEISPSKKFKLFNFWNKIQKLKNFDIEYLKSFLEEEGYFDYIKRDDLKNGSDRMENVNKLLEELEEVKDINEWLNYASLMSSSEKQNRDNAVSLMTLHSSKGLEFDYCFLTGVVDGLIPRIKDSLYETYNEIFSKETGTELKQYEEERRLFYVGITRARKGVYILHSRKRMINGKISDTYPSPFIRELSYIQDIQKEKKRTVQKNNYNLFKKPPKKETPKKNKDLGFRKGMVVKHPTYGNGEILAVISSPDDQKLIVYFPSTGKKVMSGSIAPLSKVNN